MGEPGTSEGLRPLPPTLAQVDVIPTHRINRFEPENSNRLPYDGNHLVFNPGHSNDLYPHISDLLTPQNVFEVATRARANDVINHYKQIVIPVDQLVKSTGFRENPQKQIAVLEEIEHELSNSEVNAYAQYRQELDNFDQTLPENLAHIKDRMKKQMQTALDELTLRLLQPHTAHLTNYVAARNFLQQSVDAGIIYDPENPHYKQINDLLGKNEWAVAELLREKTP